MRKALLLVFALSAVPLAASAQSAAPEASDAGQIYDRARAVWRAQQYPPILRYDVVLRYKTKDHPVTLTHAGLWQRGAGRIFVKPISQEEAANPHRPSGTNFNFLIIRSNPEFFEPFGVPQLSPVYSFGLAGKSKAIPLAREPAEEGAPKEIGSVSIVARDYRVTLVGLDGCADGSGAYHLGLVPRRKPDEFRLRDLWVRETDFTTCKLHVSKNFAESPIGEGPWEIRYAQTGLGTLIQSEEPLAKLEFRGTELTNASISFENIVAARPDVHTDLWMLGLSGTQGNVTREPDVPE